MLSKPYFILIFCFFGITANAQTKFQDLQEVMLTLKSAAAIQSAMYLLNSGHHEAALAQAEIALADITAAEGKENEYYPLCLWLKGVCLLHQTDKVAEGENIVREALVLSAKNPINNTLFYQTFVMTTADVLNRLHKYELSHEMFAQMVDIAYKKHTRNSEAYTSALTLAGSFGLKIPAYYDEAIPMLLKADTIATQNQYKTIAYLAKISIANAYIDARRIAEAQIILKNLIDNPIKGTKEQKNIITVVNNTGILESSAIQNLANTFFYQKDYANAEFYYNKVKDKTFKIKPKGYAFPVRIPFLGVKNNLAVCYAHQKKYKEAEKLYLQVLKYYRKEPFAMLGTQNNTGIDAAANLAIMYYDWGKPEKGEPVLRNVLQDIYTKFTNYCKYLSVDEIEQSRATLVLYTNKYQELNIAANYTAQQDNALLYNIELHFKGLILQNATALKTSILTNNDADLMQKYNVWVEYNRQLDEMQKDKKNKKRAIADLKTIERNAYRELCDRSKVFKKLADFWTTDVKRIQNELSPTSAGIEFLYYKKTTNDAATLQTDTTTYYAALIVFKTGAPIYIQLGTAAKINNLLLRKYDTANEEAEINAIYTNKQDDLYQQVWQPIQTALQAKNVTDIYYAPSGVLHNLSFDAVVANKIKCNLHRMSSTRQLLQRNNATQTPTSIVAFGDIEYEADDNELNKLSPKLAQKSAANTFFVPLSATDIDGLKAIANKKRILYTAYMDLAANEAQFKQLGTATKSASPTILHISTHGFYLPFDTADTSNTGKGVLSASPDPLARSGLALAGANRFWRNAADTVTAENGVLLANEIAQCNLQQTDLVVLSACETALGDINGEGVFGLQRGFKQAGAQSILMSLWHIDDAASAEMLIAFYTFYLVENQTKQQAFDAAQTKMRAQYPNSPYIWASFVLLD